MIRGIRPAQANGVGSDSLIHMCDHIIFLSSGQQFRPDKHLFHVQNICVGIQSNQKANKPHVLQSGLK